MIKRGKFIVIEGIDGAGTTTQATLLATRLQELGVLARLTAEPSTGPVGSMIRQILDKRLSLLRRSPPVDSPRELNQEALALLFAGDRLDHIESLILPSLENGTHVICDRYSPSTYAYQGMDVKDQQWLENIDQQSFVPDVIIYLKITAQEALARVLNRGGEISVFEKETFLTGVVSRYNTYIEAEEKLGATKVLTVNATLAPEVLAEMIWHDCREILTQ